MVPGAAKIDVALGVALGLAIGALLWRSRRKRKDLPEPSECPTEGVFGEGKIAECARPIKWIFLGTHLAKMDFLQKHIVNYREEGAEMPYQVTKWTNTPITYPVRLSAEAGLLRAFGTGGWKRVGDQTMPSVVQCELKDGKAKHTTTKNSNEVYKSTGQLEEPVVLAPADCAHSLVGLLVPATETLMKFFQHMPGHYGICKSEHVEWLGWTQKPDFKEVYVHAFNYDIDNKEHPFQPPSYELPILQSHVDLHLETALPHGREFAKEWVSSIQWWNHNWLNDRVGSRRPWVACEQALEFDAILEEYPQGERNMLKHRAHPSHYARECPLQDSEDMVRRIGVTPPLATKSVVKNFLFGFGSIINTPSRSASDKSAMDAAPCRIKAEFGYVREWNFQAATAQLTALGLRKTRPGEKGATINGVIFPAPDDMSEFDRRENGYQRVKVSTEFVELCSWQSLPEDCNIYLYIPYAPAVVEKYGKGSDGYPLCSGPTAPSDLQSSEKAGLGLQPPSCSFPILQTYVDVCITGCLEHGEEFAREFIRTTFKWAPHWLNERELARRPWLHQGNYVQVDQLLREEVPDYYKCRRLESEYAEYMVGSTVHL